MKKRDLMKELLKQELSQCFKSGDQKQPLKVGIHMQLHFHYKDDPRFEPQHLQSALNSYAWTPAYLAKIVEGAVRIDLHGNPVGQVTAEDEAHAKSKLKILEEKQKLAAEQLKSIEAIQPETAVERG